jgi:hypothetical protein
MTGRCRLCGRFPQPKFKSPGLRFRQQYLGPKAGRLSVITRGSAERMANPAGKDVTKSPKCSWRRAGRRISFVVALHSKLGQNAAIYSAVRRFPMNRPSRGGSSHSRRGLL